MPDQTLHLFDKDGEYSWKFGDESNVTVAEGSGFSDRDSTIEDALGNESVKHPFQILDHAKPETVEVVVALATGPETFESLPTDKPVDAVSNPNATVVEKVPASTTPMAGGGGGATTPGGTTTTSGNSAPAPAVASGAASSTS